MKKYILITISAAILVGISFYAVQSIVSRAHRIINGQEFPIPEYQPVRGATNPMDTVSAKLDEAKRLFFNIEVVRGVERLVKKDKEPSLEQYFGIINAISAAVLASNKDEIQNAINDLRPKFVTFWSGVVQHKMFRREVIRFGMARVAKCIFIDKNVDYNNETYALFRLEGLAAEDMAILKKIENDSKVIKK